jgi:hypothetical protein
MSERPGPTVEWIPWRAPSSCRMASWRLKRLWGLTLDKPIVRPESPCDGGSDVRTQRADGVQRRVEPAAAAEISTTSNTVNPGLPPPSASLRSLAHRRAEADHGAPRLVATDTFTFSRRRFPAIEQTRAQGNAQLDQQIAACLNPTPTTTTTTTPGGSTTTTSPPSCAELRARRTSFNA